VIVAQKKLEIGEANKEHAMSFSLVVPPQLLEEFPSLASLIRSEAFPSDPTKLSLDAKLDPKLFSVINIEFIRSVQKRLEQSVVVTKHGLKKNIYLMKRAFLNDISGFVDCAAEESYTSTFCLLFSIAVVLALSGWSHWTLLSADSTDALFGPNEDSRENLDSHLVCEYCCRNVCLEPYFKLDDESAPSAEGYKPFSQHRPFCPYINQPSTDAEVGWRQLCRTMAETYESCERNEIDVSEAEVKKRTLLQTATHNDDVHPVDMYKRVRKVLDMTAFAGMNDKIAT
jgi:hypothetical protein